MADDARPALALDEETAERIKALVASGAYPSSGAVLRAALDALDETGARRDALVRRLIAEAGAEEDDIDDERLGALLETEFARLEAAEKA